MFSFKTRKKITALEDTIERQKATEEILRSRLASMETQVQSYKKRIDSLERQNKQEEKRQCFQLKEYEEKCERYADEIICLRSTYLELQNENFQLDLEKAALLGENGTLKLHLAKASSEWYNRYAHAVDQYAEIKIKYHIAIREWGIKTFDDGEGSNLTQELVEFFELFYEEEIARKKLIAQLNNVFRQIIVKSIPMPYYSYDKLQKIDIGGINAIESVNGTQADVSWPRMLSRYEVVKRYIQWSGQKCYCEEYLSILDKALIKYGWVNNEVKLYVNLAKNSAIPQYTVENVSWEEILLLDREWVQISFSVEDIIFIYCRSYQDDCVLQENISKLMDVLFVLGFGIRIIPEETLLQYMISALNNVNDHNRNSAVKRQEITKEIPTAPAFRTYSSYGTEYVSGHFRRRNGQLEWVRPHLRRR